MNMYGIIITALTKNLKLVLLIQDGKFLAIIGKMLMLMFLILKIQLVLNINI